jgi:23S rRNA (uridine2552-2'-O)-methyltransferase
MSVFDQPVSIGDVLDVTVEKEGSKGDGMAFVDGLAVFVPGTEPGDDVTIRVEKVKENCAFAEVWTDDA